MLLKSHLLLGFTMQSLLECSLSLLRLLVVLLVLLVVVLLLVQLLHLSLLFVLRVVLVLRIGHLALEPPRLLLLVVEDASQLEDLVLQLPEGKLVVVRVGFGNCDLLPELCLDLG